MEGEMERPNVIIQKDHLHEANGLLKVVGLLGFEPRAR